MADAVKRVLRRKKQLLWDHLTVDDVLIGKMQEEGLLENEDLHQLMVSKISFPNVNKRMS